MKISIQAFKESMNRKLQGNLGTVQALFIALLALAVVIGITYAFLSQLLTISAIAGNANATAGVNTIESAVNLAVSFVSLIVLVIIAVVVLSYTNLLGGGQSDGRRGSR